MSGHNKWSKVKHTKGPLDAKRGKVFSKLIKEITVAAKMGGGDPDGNPRLRQAILEAKTSSMPKDNIERAIKKGTGELQDGAAIESFTYEGYGPGGVAILIETATDNKNRTVSELRSMFKNGGGALGEEGSVAWMFEPYGQILFDAKQHSEDQVMEVALEAGAQDVSAAEDLVEVRTGTTDIYKVKDAFEKVGMHPTSATLSFLPKTPLDVEDKAVASKLLALLHNVEDHDDVQKVHTNMHLSDELLAQVSS